MNHKELTNRQEIKAGDLYFDDKRGCIPVPKAWIGKRALAERRFFRPKVKR